MSLYLGSIYVNSVLTDQLPALEATTSDMVRVNSNALHAVRKKPQGNGIKKKKFWDNEVLMQRLMWRKDL